MRLLLTLKTEIQHIARNAKYRKWKKERDKLGLPSSKRDYKKMEREIAKERLQHKKSLLKKEMRETVEAYFGKKE